MPADRAPDDRQAGLREALDAMADSLNVLDGVLDPEHPEGHACDICRVADELPTRWLAVIDAALAAQVPAQEERLREALVFWAEGWDGEPGSLPTPEGMRNLYAIVEQARALEDESKEEGAAEHEHYWVDAADDETGWHCTVCGATEYPEPPFGAEAGPERYLSTTDRGPDHAP